MSDLDKTIDLSRFEVIKYLDQGSFGRVFEVSEKSTKKIFAAKISKETVDPGSKEATLNLLREVNINASISHPSVLQFVGFSYKDFENNDKPVIITELAQNGSLSKVIDYEKKGLSIPGWDDTKKLINIFGIASGMSFLHSQNLLHRDLKLANILTDDRLFPKIADFGLSKKYYEDGFASSTQSILGLKGTPAYLAPEIIEKNTYTPAGDVYAFGIIVYEIITNEQLFPGLSIKDIFDLIKNGERPKIPKFVSEHYNQLIQRCWSQNPEDRPTFDQIVEELKSDKFITPTIEEGDFLDYVDFIEKYRKSYDKDKIIINFEDIVNNYQKKTFQKVSIVDLTNKFENENILPPMIYSELNENCQKLVDEAANDLNKKFCVGKYLIEGKKGFPVDVEHGIKYLERSDFEGCVDAALYLSQIYLKGELIPKDELKAKEYLLKYEYKNESSVYNSLGNFYKRKGNDLIKARKYFEKGAKLLNSESMFNYAMMLIRGEGGNKNINEAIELLNMSKKHGYNKSARYLSIYNEIKTNVFFLNLPEEIQHIFTLIFFNKNSDKINMNLDIEINDSDIEYICKKKLFSNPEFINTLESFQKITFEINYPSDSFARILAKVTEIKSNFLNNINICVFILNSETSIKDSAFNGCSSLTQISIPSSVTEIGSDAFSECSSLKQITIPSSVTKIEDYVFAGCSSLTQITIPSSVTEIKDNVFQLCSSLTQISIPSSVTEIGNSSFSECSSLKKIIFSIPSSVTKIGNYAFSECSSLTQITIPSSVTEIGSETFSKCSSLMQISIPSSVTKICEGTFSYCKSLTQITIPSSVTKIEDSAFYECSSLIEISIPSSVTSIGNSAFEKCSSLTQVSIPSSVIEIGDSAFSECSSLTPFQLPDSVTSVGNNIFNGCKSSCCIQ